MSQQAAAKAAALADFAEEAERNALETSLLDEANRMQSEADKYERLVQSIVTSAEEAAGAAGAADAAEASQAAGAEAVAEDARESLRAVHERAIAAMEMQYESKRRAAAAKLAQRKAALRAARAEALRAAGRTEEEITKELAEVGRPHMVPSKFGRSGNKTYIHALCRVAKLSNPNKGTRFHVVIYTTYEPRDQPPIFPFARRRSCSEGGCSRRPRGSPARCAIAGGSGG